MAVNKQRVQLLVDALESGEFAKGEGRLCLRTTSPDGSITEKLCCLGVGGRVAMANGLQVDAHWTMRNPDANGIAIQVIDGSTDVMGDNVRDWFGFDSCNPALIRRGGTAIAAATWNDEGPQVTFADIAGGFRRTYLEGGDN